MTTHPDPEDLRAMVAAATPGPWEDEAQGVYAFEGTKYIARVSSHDHGIDWPSTEANAHLIAKAPQLALGYADALEREAAKDVRIARLEAALERSKRLRDQYREALDAERKHSNPARAALEAKP